jgi:uncharacterized protein
VTRQAAADAFRFPLAGLLAEPPGSSRDLRIGPVELDLDGDPKLAGPVSGSAHVARTNRGVIVRAAFATALEESCSRCLDPVAAPLSVAIEEEVLPSIDLASGLPVDTATEPEVQRLTDHHELDLEPLVRDAILLAEPIAPLCRPDCPGLCAECGARLADGPHVHADDEIDPRLAALQGFRVDGEAENG